MTELRDAREVAVEICGCAYADQRKRDAAIITADRAAVREQTTAAIVAWLRGQAEIGRQRIAILKDNDAEARGHAGAVLALTRAADAIERSEHRQAQDPTDEQH